MLLFFFSLTSLSSAELKRGLNDRGALILRSVCYDIPGFSKVELMKFSTGYTTLRLHDYSFNVYEKARIYINNSLYLAPLYYKYGTVAKYQVNTLSGGKGVALNGLILNADTIQIAVLINYGLSDLKLKIDLPYSVLEEWKKVISTDIYKDCINGTETSPVSNNFLKIQWGCRGNDDFYRVAILNEDGSEILYSSSTTGNNLHTFYPEKEVPLLKHGKYMWKVWSTPSRRWGGTAFQGTFFVERYQ